MIDNLLVTPGFPPLYGYVMFSAGNNDPKWNCFPNQLLDLRVPSLFILGEVNVSLEQGRLDLQAEAVV